MTPDQEPQTGSADLGPGASTSISQDDRLRISLSGQVADRLAVISQTFTSLLTCFGDIPEEKKQVLVPLVEISFKGNESGVEEGSNSESLFSQLVTLDNAAFVISDIASDLRIACVQLQSVSGGPIFPDLRSVELIQHFFAKVVEDAQTCHDEIGKLLKTLRTDKIR